MARISTDGKHRENTADPRWKDKMLAKEEEKKNVDAIQFAGEMYHHEGSGPTTEELNKAAARGSSLTQKKEQAEKDLTYTKKYMDAKWDMVESTEQSLLNFYAELGLEEDYRRLEEMKAEFERNPSSQLAQEHNALVDSIRRKEQELKVYEKSYQDTVDSYNALGQQGQNQWEAYQEVWDKWDQDRRVTHYMMDDYQENNWDLLSEEAKAALQGHDNDQNEDFQSSIDWIDGRFLEIDSEIENVQKIHDEKLMYYREYYDEHGEYPKSYPEIEAELNSYQERIHGLEAEKKQRQQTRKNETNELNFRQQYIGLKYNDDFQEYASYAPAEQGAFSIVSDTKDTYYRINNVPVARGIFDKWDTSKDHLKEMKPDEIDIFNYLYQKQGEDEAQKYIEDITPVLYRRQRESKEKAIADFAEESWGNSALASVNSILTKPLEGFSYLGQGIDYLMDGEIDENAPYNAFVYENQAARSAVSKKIEKQWGETGSFLYQLGMGLGDFVYTLALSHGLAAGAGAAGLSTGAVAKTASRISLAIMSTEAAAETVLDAKDRGLEDKDAFWLGTIAGATELVTEKVSIEKLLDKVGMGKNALTYLLKNALAEGSEEITGDAVNWLADVMISQDKSEWQETLFHYQVMGFSEDEAFLAAMKEQGRKMLKDGAAGAITGTIMSGGRLAGSKIQDGIQNYRNYKGAVQNGRIYHDLNNMTKGDLARSLGYMDIEQEYKTSLPVALEAESRSGSEIRSLLEANGYSLEGEFGDRNTDISLRESKAQHSIQTLPDGKKYVKADRQVISGNNPQKWAGQITNYINQQIRKGKNVMLVTDNDDLLQITQNTAGKAQFRNLVLQPSGFYQPMTDDQYAVKLRAEGHIDELAQISSRGNKIVPDGDGKHKAMASNGWNYRTAYFEDADGKYYQLTISTALGKNGNTVYNIAKIKERTPAGGESKVKTSGALPFRGSSAENGGAQVQFRSSNASIPISTEKVNGSGMNLDQSIRLYGVDPQKAALVTRLANDTGAKVLFDGTLTEECEGYEKDGVIYLNPNANNIKAIFSHELTHVLERTDSYQTLRNMVLSQYGNNTALQNALDAKRKNYQAHGVELTRAEAAQELVAEFAGERLFTDISAIRRLASYDLNLAGKIGSAISRMASKATGNPEKSFLRNAEHMYTQAIRENSALSPTEARFLLESNGYSVKDSPQLPSLLRDGEGGQLQRDEVGRKPFELFADTTEDALNSETNSGGKQTDLLVDTPLTEEENQRIIRNRVENGEYSLRHSHQHYLKHVEGTPQYNNYLRTQLEKGASPPSKLTITEAEAEAIIKKYYGTGTSRKSKGKVGNVEFITVDKVVGVYYENGSWHETKRVAIHYGSNASHIVPVKEKYHD